MAVKACQSDIIFIDEYTVALGSSIGNDLEKIHNIICRYLQYLQDISDDGFIDGELADAFLLFVESVQKIISTEGGPDQIGKSVQSESGEDDYVRKIDEADDPLY